MVAPVAPVADATVQLKAIKIATKASKSFNKAYKVSVNVPDVVLVNVGTIDTQVHTKTKVKVKIVSDPDATEIDGES